MEAALPCTSCTFLTTPLTPLPLCGSRVYVCAIAPWMTWWARSSCASCSQWWLSVFRRTRKICDLSFVLVHTDPSNITKPEAIFPVLGGISLWEPLHSIDGVSASRWQHIGPVLSHSAPGVVGPHSSPGNVGQSGVTNIPTSSPPFLRVSCHCWLNLPVFPSLLSCPFPPFLCDSCVCWLCVSPTLLPLSSVVSILETVLDSHVCLSLPVFVWTSVFARLFPPPFFGACLFGVGVAVLSPLENHAQVFVSRCIWLHQPGQDCVSSIP